MSLAEAAPELKQPIFGPITYAEMHDNEHLAKGVMSLVGDACKRSKGRFTTKRIAEGLVSGEFRLWGVLSPPAVLESVAVTTIDPFPNGEKVFEIVLIGPKFASMLAFISRLEAEARAAGCSRIKTIGPGNWRPLPAETTARGLPTLPRDWQRTAYVYEKTLT